MLDREGLMWFCQSGTLKQNVERAILHYKQKHGEDPEVAHINHPDFDDLDVKIEVVENKSITPKHLWVGEKNG
jgi:hypothetical protein